MKNSISIFIVCLFFVSIAKADLIVEPSKQLPFRITNLDKFMEYEFYYLHRSYSKKTSSNKAKIDTLKIKDSQFYIGGNRGEGTFLIAKKDGKVVAVSTLEIQGTHQSNKKKIKKVSQNIEITAVKDGKVVFEVKEYQYEFENGKTKVVKAGLEQSSWFLGLSFLALLLLTILFYHKNKKFV